ncbi:MAG: ImmA/IrrE family metallo-endopeptidase [Candidatus Aquilonibacter sp.]|jgi:predicted transcriptional regulator
MKRALEMADAYGVAVEFADLGAWGAAELRSEYDPHGPVIRINQRLTMREELIALCIFHELYHHREAIGDVRRQGSRRAREAAADAFARAQMLPD